MVYDNLLAAAVSDPKTARQTYLNANILFYPA
jgi:hypothetical protein